jgi:D-alanyl-D-alanine carboxypeptidase
MKLTDILSFRQIKIFLLAFVPMLIITVLPHLGITPKKLVSPKPELPVMEQSLPNEIKSKLEERKLTFQLKKSPAFVPEAKAAAEFDGAKAYGVINLNTGEVLLEKNFSERLPIASLTKVMTAVVALDLADLNSQFSVSEKASMQVPTKIMLKPGEKVSLENLLKSALISSANDSAQVIKEGVDNLFNKDIFIQSMNEKAKILGLKNSHFTNPQGFDNVNHFSSVEDLSLLSVYALDNPFIRSIVSKELEDLSNQLDERFYLRNWNGLQGMYGLKIGNTEKAGFTTIVASEREGQKVLVVLLGAPGVKERDLWAGELLDLGFSKLGLKPVGITEDQLQQKYQSWNR